MLILGVVRDLLYAVGDGLDRAIETLAPSDRGLEIHRFYEEAVAE